MKRRGRRPTKLEALAAGVVERVRFDPPELNALLRPPRLRVVEDAAQGLNGHCVRRPDGTTLIVLGDGLRGLCRAYARGAATYFLPAEPDGERPSPLWPRSRAALATAVDWLAVATESPHTPAIDVSSHHAIPARAFGDFAFRFALCHEMAHVALGHLDAGPSVTRRLGREDVDILRALQEQELEADRFGLHLQLASLPVVLRTTALASAAYFVHILGLLDLRLMLLAELVDWHAWQIEHSHPPTLRRVFGLIGAAASHDANGAEGMKELHDALDDMDAEVRITALGQANEVARATRELADANASSDATTHALLRLLERSPTGVLRGLEPPDAGGPADRLAAALPPELRAFRDLTAAERADR